MSNSQYFNQDCLEVMPTIPDKSVDLIFCDLPYHSTNCKWDSAIDLDKLWVEFKRIRKDTTPIVMTCTTRFGLELIKANPKEFRFDMVWQKSRKCGFLQARKRPLCNHEMVYFFYKKQPKYNYLKYHKYSKKESSKKALTGDCYNQTNRKNKLDKGYGTYDPTLPASVIVNDVKSEEDTTYGAIPDSSKRVHAVSYDPPLPASVIVNDNVYGEEKRPDNRCRTQMYDPALPASVIVGGNLYCKNNIERRNDTYDPQLPVSVIVNDEKRDKDSMFGQISGEKGVSHATKYDPQLPASILKIASKKPSKHQTGKPLELMEFILKYWTDENDTVFDPTFGGGSMPIQCKLMNRKFIGCEMDKKFYDDTLALLNGKFDNLKLK